MDHMDKVKKIYEGIREFRNTFIMKYEYENIGRVRKMRIDSRLNLDIDDEKWRELFLNKSCFNHCAKIIFLRYIEDCGLAYIKMNKMGIEKWNHLVKNISYQLNILYDIAIRDLQEDDNHIICNIFKKSDYDLFKIDEELAKIIIERLSMIDFSELTKEDYILLFEKVFSLEKREEMKLNKFYKDAPALSYMLKLKKGKGLLIK